MQTVTITQEHYSDLQMTIAKLLKQVDGLKQQLDNTLEIGSHLASNLQKQRDENERLRAKQLIITDDDINLLKDARIRLEQLEKENKELRTKQPHYIATITIDSWHCDGSHFPAYVGTAHGTSLQEAFDHAILLHLQGHYRLTDIPEKVVPCSNFLYANGREVNVIIKQIS